MKIAFVTGATGCVGRNIVNELLLAGWKVTVLHRRSSDLSKLKDVNVRFQEIDMLDLESVRHSIPEGVDGLFHAAGNTSHWAAEEKQQYQDNVIATRHLVQVALEKKVKRFIFTSTNATQDYQGWDEHFSQKISPSYVRTKRLSELEVYKGVERGLDAVILRPIIVIGAYDYNSYAQIFHSIAHSPIRFAFPGRIPFCHARDVARAHVQAFEKGRCCEHYVLGGTRTTWTHVFQKIADTMGIKTRVYTLPKPVLWLAAHIMNFISIFTGKKPLLTPELVSLLHDAPDVTYYETRKAFLELGYKSASLDEMIQDCYDWLVSEGRLK